MSADASLDGIARELCSRFLGWRLREDRDALIALEEGTLRIDLKSGECWCDGEPLPALFIAGELKAELERVEVSTGALIERARLDAEFSRRDAWVRGQERTALDIACRVELSSGSDEGSAAANNAAPADVAGG